METIKGPAAQGSDSEAFVRRFFAFFGDVPPEEYALMIVEDPSTLGQFVDWAARLLHGMGKPPAGPSAIPASPTSTDNEGDGNA